MWIIPLQIRESLAIALDSWASKEELNERLEQSEPLLMWKSKPLSAKTFWLAWKRVYWMQHLFGRILKPSIQNLFVVQWTALLGATPASHLAMQEEELAKKIQDTYTRIWNNTSVQYSLFGASSKMLPDTSVSDSQRSAKAFETWVSQLRQESLQQRKLARHTKGKGSLFLRFSTPQSRDYKSADMANSKNYLREVKATAPGSMHSTSLQKAVVINWITPIANQVGTTGKGYTPKLHQQLLNWGTPRCSCSKSGYEKKKHKSRIEDMVHTKWPTVTTQDAKNNGSESQQNRNSQPLNTMVLTVGQQDQDKSNTNGNRPVLNPEWIAQLMGTTLEKTFFVPMVIP